MRPKAHFFSCDWGTTSFRLRHVDAQTGAVLAQCREPSGVRALSSSCPADDTVGRERAFADFLRSQLRLLAGNNTSFAGEIPVIISGMASSSVGWRELPYASVPVGVDGANSVQDVFSLSIDGQWQARIRLISGVRTESDMLRGEETEIFGIFSGNRYGRIAENGIVVLPGTHSKHVRLKAGQLTDFHTFMTGELFDVLAAHSLLRVSVEPSDLPSAQALSDEQSRDAFIAGVRTAATRGLAASLFQTRARTVLQKVAPPVNRWFLSGLLIGSEVLDLSTREGDVPVLLAAVEPLSAAYRLAFETIGLAERMTVIPADEMALASVRGHRTLLRSPLKSGEVSRAAE